MSTILSRLWLSMTTGDCSCGVMKVVGTGDMLLATQSFLHESAVNDSNATSNFLRFPLLNLVGVDETVLMITSRS